MHICQEADEDGAQAIYNIKFDSIYEFLEGLELENGVIRLSSEIDATSARDLSRRLRYMVRDGRKEITLFISSPGGDVYHAFQMFDAIEEAKADGVKVIGVVEGVAASAAAMIVLQACSVRQATKHSRLLLHEASRWVMFEREKTSEMEDEVKEMQAVTKMIVEILANRTGKSEEDINTFIRRKEQWMNAEQAKEFGLIDEVI